MFVKINFVKIFVYLQVKVAITHNVFSLSAHVIVNQMDASEIQDKSIMDLIIWYHGSAAQM